MAYILFFDSKKNIIIYMWSLTLVIVIIDIYFEFFIGHNLIGIKGAYGYSLKQIGKAMYKNRLINTYWQA
jgi:hypothetical protein